MQSLYMNCQRLEEAVNRAATNAGRIAIQRATAAKNKEEAAMAALAKQRAPPETPPALPAEAPTAQLAPGRTQKPPAGPASAHPPKGGKSPDALEDEDPLLLRCSSR